jgi:hypothetical protein
MLGAARCCVATGLYQLSRGIVCQRMQGQLILYPLQLLVESRERRKPILVPPLQGQASELLMRGFNSILATAETITLVLPQAQPRLLS